MQVSFDRVLNGLLPDGGAVLLAVSGGVDSMCMADLFINSGQRRRFSVAHCNFHLRGEESDADEALVREWCETRGIVFIKMDFDTLGYAASNGVSVEMAARDLRYAWFAGLCRENGFAALAVAHNANDNAETMILNMLRGTGVKGMTGMRRSSPLLSSDVPLIRPLLGFTRKDIQEYAVSHHLEWREDRTNADPAYKRNLVRNEVFPLFERLNPSFLVTLNEDMERFSQVQSAADEYVSGVSADVVRYAEDGLPIVDYQRLTLKKSWEYVLYRLLEPFGFGSSVVSDLAASIRRGVTVSGRTFIADEYYAVTSAREIRVIGGRFDGNGLGNRPGVSGERLNPAAETSSGSLSGPAKAVLATSSSAAVPEETASLTIEGPGEYSLDGTRFSVSLSGDVTNVRTTSGETKLDSCKVTFPFVVRHWLPGDWMRPLGLGGRKKLSDLFVDLKFGLVEKRKALVIADKGSRVLALVGHRIDDSVKVTKGTASVTVIRLI